MEIIQSLIYVNNILFNTHRFIGDFFVPASPSKRREKIVIGFVSVEFFKSPL